MSNLSTFLTQFASVLKGASFAGIVAGVTKGFEWADGGMSPIGRLKLSQWLKNVPGDEQIDTWASVFPKLIDSVFGPKALSWRFFLRSCIASVVAVFVTLGLAVLSYGSSQIDSDYGAGSGSMLVLTLIFALIANCVPDYISILVSRFIVITMAKRPTGGRIALLLLLDTSITFAFAYLSIFLIQCLAGFTIDLAFTQSMLDALESIPREAIPTFRHTLIAAIETPAVRIYFFASLFTSVWVWLYVLASVTIRILHKARFIWVRLMPILSVEDKPMQAVGRVAGLIAGFGYLALLSAVWLYMHV